MDGATDRYLPNLSDAFADAAVASEPLLFSLRPRSEGWRRLTTRSVLFGPSAWLFHELWIGPIIEGAAERFDAYVLAVRDQDGRFVAREGAKWAGSWEHPRVAAVYELTEKGRAAAEGGSTRK